MKLYAKYISLVYLKYFTIFFIAFELFYIGIDALTNLSDLPSSANLVLLYLGLTALVAIKYILPLSLMFALIASSVSLIRSNELVSLYALGISKNRIIIIPFIISLIITAIYLGLSSTKIAYAREYQNAIETFQNPDSYSNGIFLKFENKFIYIDRLFANINRAQNIRIFEVKDGKLTSKTTAKKATFSSDSWQLYDAEITSLPNDFELGGDGLSQSTKKDVVVLKNFSPQIIENIYKSGSYSIIDAITTLKALNNEGLNTSSVKSALYTLIFFPFFAPFMVVILYYYMPITERFARLAVSSFAFVATVLGLWGALFVMGRFAQNGIVAPELAIIAPIAIICAFAAMKFIKNS